MLRCDQRSFQIQGKLRQADLFEISGWPSSASAKTSSQIAFVSSGLISAKPALSQVARSHSTMKVLIAGA